MRKQSKAEKLIDCRIEKAYRASCCGIGIDILDIPKVFARGREIVASGATDEALAAQLHSYVTSISKN